ncbi:MAG TPA: ATP-grasp domain-containing protein [Myxococcales bacterium]|nr:ATP-grasp domain-containing protein [Myxococcales bacterium]
MTIAILFGGTSPERRVSVASAQHMLDLLVQIEPCTPWFEGPDGAISFPSEEELRAHQRVFETDFLPRAPPAFPSLAAALDGASVDAGASVFFLALHGGTGEDGTVQKQLEARALAFTGSGSLASARAFDKTVAKQLVRDRGVRTAEAIVLPQNDVGRARRALDGLMALHGRIVVKPVAGGSSFGLYHVLTAEDAARAAEAVARADEIYLAEEFIDGPELTIGVVENGGVRALPATEVRLDPGRAFDFEGKYLGKGSIELTPAQVPDEVARGAQALAIAAHEALGCEGYTRTDLIVGKRGPVFLEINTLPGLTRASFIPQKLTAEGTSMLSFLSGQLGLARKRAARG